MPGRRPIRWNPMPVKIKVLADGSGVGAVGDTILDEDFKEVLGGVNIPFDDTLDLQAQIVYKEHDRREPVIGGDEDTGDGHLTFTLEFLEGAGLDPLGAGPKIKKGDRVVEVAGVTTDYRIIEVRPSGHLRSVDQKPMLWMCYFQFPADQHARMV